jgi:hypothetical protein
MFRKANDIMTPQEAEELGVKVDTAKHAISKNAPTTEGGHRSEHRSWRMTPCAGLRLHCRVPKKSCSRDLEQTGSSFPPLPNGLNSNTRYVYTHIGDRARYRKTTRKLLSFDSGITFGTHHTVQLLAA